MAKPQKKQPVCETCGTLGYLLWQSIRRNMRLRALQRCDACKKYKNDFEAVEAAKKDGWYYEGILMRDDRTAAQKLEDKSG